MEVKKIIDKMKIAIIKDEKIELTSEEGSKVVEFIENILDIMMKI